MLKTCILVIVALLMGFIRLLAPPKQSGCIDAAQIRKDAPCTMEYNPVCGSNGQTHANACQARNTGVTRFSPGACAEQTKP